MTLPPHHVKKIYGIEFCATKSYAVPTDVNARVPMIARVRRAQIHPAQLEAFRHFEQTQCLPMLRRQPGFLGGLFLRESPDRAVSLTFWEGSGAVEALKSSPSYLKTALELTKEELLIGEPITEVWGVRGGELRVEALLQMLEVLSKSS